MSPETRSEPVRLVSIDAFRGLTIIGMILVNNPGNWNYVYAPLLHAEWHGWTPTDLIFPFFLFIVGVVIPLALGRRLTAGTSVRVLLRKVTIRSLMLIGLGLFLSGFPFALFGPRSFERLLEAWRFPGVLQRIGVCYFFAALLFMSVSESRRRRTIGLWIVVLLLGYWLLMTLVPVPGVGAPDLDSKGDHLAGWLDRAVFGEHVWVSSKVYDPEGLLSTLPALATTLFGVLAGLLLTGGGEGRTEGTVHKVARLFVGGSVLVMAGYVWNWFFPINKALWTSSYAVFTAGVAACALALCVWFFDIQGHRKLARPLEIYGVNAITVFVGSGLLAKTLIYVKVGERSLQSVIHQTLFASWLPAYAASLAYALTWIAGWFFVLAWMDRKGLYLKV